MLHLLHRLSLRTRISLMTLAIVLLGLWGLTLFASTTLRKDMPEFIGQQQASAAHILADDIEREVQRHFTGLESVAAHAPPAALQSPQAAQVYLATRPGVAEMFNGGIVLYNRRGVALGDTLPGSGRLGQVAPDPAMLARVMDQGAPAISRPLVDKVQQTPQFGMTVPVRNSAGIVVGAVVGVVQLALPNFLDPVRQGHYAKGGDYLLIDRTSRLVVAATDPKRILSSIPAAGVIPAVDRMVDGAQGTFHFVNSLGVEVQASVRQLPTTPWYIAVSLPTATAMAPIENMQMRLWVAATLIALLTWLLTRWMLGRHMAPALDAITQMTERMALVQADAPVQPLQVQRSDEIGQLITAFNHQLGVEAQRKALLHEVLNTSNVGIFAGTGEGTITLANETMGRLFGRTSQSMVGMTYIDLVTARERQIAQANQATLRANQGMAIEVTRRFVRADGTEFWGHTTVRQFTSPGDQQRGVVGVVNDITTQIEGHDYELFRRRTLELLARNTGLSQTLEAIVRGVEGLRPDALCGILLLQKDGKHLAQGVAPSLPADYNAAIEGLEIGPFVGSCGAAAYSGERVVAQDLQTHANWAAYRELAERANLRACWSQPLVGREGEVLGTIAMYHRVPQAPQEKDVELIEQAAHLASLAILQHRDAQSALESEERFRRVMETSPSVAVRGYRADGTVVFWNHAAERLYGYSAAEALGQNLVDLIFPAESHAQVRETIAGFFASGQTPPAGELQLVTKQGTAVTVFSSHALLLRDNHPTECFCMDVDLSEREHSASALRESEARYRAMIEWSPHPMAVHRDGLVVYVNPATVAMMAAPDAQALLGKPILDFVHPDSRALVLERAQQVARTGMAVPTVAEKYLRLDGATIEVEAIATHIVFGGADSVLVSMQDVTRRNQANQRLLLSAQVFDNAREGIMVTDAHGDIVEVNAAFTRITGYERDEVLGRNPRLLNSGRQGKDYYASLWQALLDTGNWTGEVWNRRKSGEIYAELQTISTVRDAMGQTLNYVSLFSDVTAAKEHAQYIERIAHYDALTNLPNRVLLADRLQQAMKQAQRRDMQTAVAFLDLDGFKNVNDLHGHDVGDELLLVLAQRMRKALREGDTLARMGGDEFVAVIVDLPDPQACVPLLARLLEAAAEPVLMGDSTLQVTASVGVAFYPQAEEVDADQLLRQADQAMYQAKLAGKNRYHVFDAEQDRHVRGHHESLDRIRTALATASLCCITSPR